MQEASLATKDPLVFMGAQQTTLDNLVLIDAIFRARDSESGQLRPSFRNSPILDAWNLRRDTIIWGNRLTADEAIKMEYFSKAMNSPGIKSDSEKDGDTVCDDSAMEAQRATGNSVTMSASASEQMFVDMILRTRRRESGIPHDTMYGLLGLIPIEAQSLLLNLGVSYETSYSDTCHHYTSVLLQATADLRLINCSKTEISGQPSWVPDLRYLEPSTTFLGKGTANPILVSTDSKLLSVHGVVIGTCLHHVDGKPRSTYRYTGSDSERVKEVEQNIFAPSAMTRGVPCLDIVWELLEFVAQSTEFGTPGNLDHRKQIYERMKSSQSIGRYDFEWAADILDSLSHAYAVLEDGRIVMAKRTQAVHIAEGDELCLLGNSPYPTLLRPCGQRYQLISHCQMLDGSLKNEKSHLDLLSKRPTKVFTIE